MSKYTTEVRYICEHYAGLEESVGYANVEEVINASVSKIFDFDFPIFDENYRIPLEVKILRHFYTREISEETVGLWKLKLHDKLMMIMPYYNKLYASELITFNPLHNVDTARHNEGDQLGHNSNTNWDLFSDTPQGGINGITADSDSVADNTYLTTAEKITNNGQHDLDTEFDETYKGKQGDISYSRMLNEYRDTFLRTDERLMKELEPLFFGLW